MQKRWISLLVENEIGVLAKVTGLFSGKSYNLNSLTVGTTEDKTISRMTISLTSDDKTFEQVKKQLNRCIEIIKVMDYADVDYICKELMFIKIRDCNKDDIEEVMKIAQRYALHIVAQQKRAILLESVHLDEVNDNIIMLLENMFPKRIEIVRGGGVGIENIMNS